MKILVTGGTGFVGNHLIRELLKEKENTVYALIRDRKKLEFLNFKEGITIIDGDLFESTAFPTDIELGFHLAALTKVISPQEFIHSNHDGTRSLLDKLKIFQEYCPAPYIIIRAPIVFGPGDLDMLRRKKSKPASSSTFSPNKGCIAGNYPLVPVAKLIINKFHFFLSL